MYRFLLVKDGKFIDSEDGQEVNLIAGPVQAGQLPISPPHNANGRVVVAAGNSKGNWLEYAKLLGMLQPL